ncbi:hypothetical protein HHK36_031861 [Tetracentron sinense]|uniref:Uncharacterized protein n=1 Tax=Tetracentron sinense TaxID=13715 RepID=A0A834Y941_TETSI|nr:hypothetical protein HHK36_031861 [Tetracentron sinense]
MDHKWRNIPAFGDWDYANDLPITQYFESATQAGLLRHRSSGEGDLYKAGDLCGDDLKIPPRSTVVHRRKTKVSGRRYPHVKEQKKQGKVSDLTEQPRQQHATKPPPPRAPKAVDEDLYKIPPELLHTNPKRTKVSGRRYPHAKEQKKQGKVSDLTEQPRQQHATKPPPPQAPKAVDEDLYKIPPELLHTNPKRTKVSGRRYPHVKEQKKQGKVSDLTEQPRQQHATKPPPPRAPKAVDEDLYKIPPELLHTNPKRKKMPGFFSRCLEPTCVV